MTPTTTTTTTKFEITFWNVFHNIYLFKKIIQIIGETEWVQYKNYKQYHLENKIKFKELKSLYWFIKRDQIELLKYKLKFPLDEIIEIDERGLRALMVYSVNCKNDECISKFREIIIPLKEKKILNNQIGYINYLFKISITNDMYGNSLNISKNFNSLQIINEILSIFPNEINGEHKQFSTFQTMVDFIVEDSFKKDSILLLFKILSNHFNTQQIFNDDLQQLAVNEIKEIISQDSVTTSLKELEKLLIIISIGRDNSLYSSYLTKYDEPIQEIKTLNNLLLEYSIEKFSVNVLQYLINIDHIEMNSNSQMYIDPTQGNQQQQQQQVTINYEKYIEFIKLIYSSNQFNKMKFDSISKFRNNLINSVVSFDKEHYGEIVYYLNQVEKEIKFPICWNQILNDYSNLIKPITDLIINETSTIDWIINNQETFKGIYQYTCTSIKWGTYQVEQYVFANLNKFPEYIIKPLPFKTIEKAIMECSINEFKNIGNVTKDDFQYDFEITKDHFKLLDGQEIEKKLLFLDYLFDNWYTQFDVMFFIGDNLVELFPEWVIVKGKNIIGSNEFIILSKVIEKLVKMGPRQITNCLAMSTGSLNIETIQFIFSNFVTTLQTNSVDFQNSHYSFTTNGDIQSLNYEYNTNTIINGINYLIENYNSLIHNVTSSVINELYQRLIQVDGISIDQLINVRNIISSKSIIINDDKIGYVLDYLKIKSPKLIKYVMERGLKSKNEDDYIVSNGNPFLFFRDVSHGNCMHNIIENYNDDKYYTIEIDGYECLHADQINIPLDIQTLSFDFILGSNSNFNEILSILKSNLHSLHSPEKSINLDLIYYIEIRRMDLFQLEIENIKNNQKNNGGTPFEFNEHLIKLLQKLYNQDYINNLLL